VCMTANGTPACTAGACTIGSCSGGWGNCNAVTTDGCETNTTTDSANCGFCGNVCNNLPNVATGTCLSGSCNVVVCDGGFADCNGVAGCETSISDDPNNCGACGRSCGVGGSCSSGVCDDILQIANGQYHTCALRSSGTVACWGSNAFGQLGIGSMVDSLTPVVVPGLTDVVDLAAGWEHTCALLSDGTVQCWGNNTRHQLGDGTNATQQLSPVPVMREGTGAPLDRVGHIEAGRYTTCGLRTSGFLDCWGDNGSEMIEFDGDTDYAEAHAVHIVPSKGGKGGKGEERVSLFAIGMSYIAALVPDYGAVFMTGDPAGTIPYGSWTGYGEVWGGEVDDVVDLVSGNDHVCIRRVSGIVECAGQNMSGQLSDGTQISPFADPVNTLFTSTTAIMAFDDTTCARNTLGQVFCMGSNSEAQCTGPGSPMPVLAPRRVNVTSGGAAYFSRYLANGGGGAYRTPCLISSTGAVHCWGNNIGGQIGNGTTVGQEYPSRVLNLTP
jgi:hypothetical protein